MNTIIITGLCIVLLLGVFHIVYDIYVQKRNLRNVTSYLYDLAEYGKLIQANKGVPSVIVEHLLADGAEVSKLMGENYYADPVNKFYTAIQYGNYRDSLRYIPIIVGRTPNYEKEANKAIKETEFMLLNPFIWFYRGIEVLVYIVLGYFVKNETIIYRGKFWNTLNLIISLLGGIASIIGLFK